VINLFKSTYIDNKIFGFEKIEKPDKDEIHNRLGKSIHSNSNNFVSKLYIIIKYYYKYY